jgi:hypothetical protein
MDGTATITSASSPPWVSPVQFWLEDEIAKKRVSGRWTLISLIYITAIAQVIALILAVYVMIWIAGAWAVLTNISIVVLAAAVADAAYFAFYRYRLHRTPMKSGVFMWERSRFGNRSMSDHEHLYVWFIDEILRWLMFPAYLLELTWDYAVRLKRLRNFNCNLGARVLILLAQSPRRVSIYDIEDELHADDLAATLNSLRHLPGVMLRTSEFVALAVNDELRAEVLGRAGLSKEDENGS